MAKTGEINYVKNLTNAEIAHAVHKPFSDPQRASYLSEIAAVLKLLPPPPCRLLDLGCGTGWTTLFFARCGYDVVGVDIAEDMIALARRSQAESGLENVDWLACDYENLPFNGEFDAAVFYDSLHHAVDEQAAMNGVYRALRLGGVCVTSEPGEGHHVSHVAQAAMDRFEVTEKDMSPLHITALGRRTGFSEVRVYPHAWDNMLIDYATEAPLSDGPLQSRSFLRRCFHGAVRRVLRMDGRSYAVLMRQCRTRASRLIDFPRFGGIVCLVKSNGGDNVGGLPCLN